MYTTEIIQNKIYVCPKGKTPDLRKELEQQLVTLGGEYDRESKRYIFPFTDDKILELHKIAAINKYLYIPVAYTDTKVNYSRVAHLRDYQIAPLEFMLSRGGRVLLADNVGLGKTITSYSFFQYTSVHYPLLVVCPASIKYQWEREFTRFDTTGKTVYVCEGVDSIGKVDADVVIINYDLFSRHVFKEKQGRRTRYRISDELTALKSMNFQGVILDECQRLKSPTTLWIHGIKHVTKDAPYMLALSATPLENKTEEFYNILNMLRPDIWHDYNHFVYRYCDAHMASRYIRKGKRAFRQEYLDVTGESNLQELYQLLDYHVMFRRAKIDGIPLTVPVVIPVKMSKKNKKLYEDILNDEADITTRTGGTAQLSNPLVKAGMLKRFAAAAKLDSVIAFLKDFLIDSEDKIVVFTEHHDTIDNLHEAFKKTSVKFDGRCSSKAKEIAKDKFIQDPKTRIFLGQTTAAGVGLDGLQDVAYKLMYAELPYKPSSIQQCNGRLERPRSSELSGNVIAYFPILMGTIEEDIIGMLVNKHTNMLTVLDGEDNNENISQKVYAFLKDKGLDSK